MGLTVTYTQVSSVFASSMFVSGWTIKMLDKSADYKQ